ncbi:MAG: hypothetical protein LUD01_07795 [Clostridiales bacterium]|nr:hypothetical protein [Clostridiales bacterium]
MGKVQYIKKSRKAYTCGKCRQTIPAGSPYYRGILNFYPPIIRCGDCGLKSYEVTGSEYSRAVGELVENWAETYAIEEGVWESVAEALQEIYDGVEERYENIPEGLKEGSSGELLQERMDELQGAIDELDFDFEGILSEAVDELDEEEREVITVCELNEAWQRYSADGCEGEAFEHWKEAVEGIIENRIDDVLGELSW